MSAELGNIISFPAKTEKRSRAKRDGSRVKNIDGVKYFSEKQIKMIRRAVRDQAELDEKKKNVTAIKEWMVIDLLTSTGLRVSEAVNLRCGDLKLGYSESKIFVRDGTGHQSAHVVINDSLKKH
jgi:integrase/recombinase XerD